MEQQAAPGYSVVNYTGSQGYKTWDGGTTVNGVYYLCEDSASTAIAFSTDKGATWQQKIPLGANGDMFRSLVAVDTVMMAGGYSGGSLSISFDQFSSVSYLNMIPYGMTMTNLAVKTSGQAFLVHNTTVNAAVSQDGINWTAVTLPAAPTSVTNTVSIKDKFVLIAATGIIVGDAIGSTFGLYATPITPLSACYGNGLWAINNAAGFATTTRDFVTFNTSLASVMYPGAVIGHFNEKLKVFTSAFFSAFYYSSDCITWLQANPIYFVTSSNFRTYQFADGSILTGVSSSSFGHRFHEVTDKVLKIE